MKRILAIAPIGAVLFGAVFSTGFKSDPTLTQGYVGIFPEPIADQRGSAANSGFIQHDYDTSIGGDMMLSLTADPNTPQTTFGGTFRYRVVWEPTGPNSLPPTRAKLKFGFAHDADLEGNGYAKFTDVEFNGTDEFDRMLADYKGFMPMFERLVPLTNINGTYQGTDEFEIPTMEVRPNTLDGEPTVLRVHIENWAREEVRP